ncbi:MAG: glycosyl transferase family 36 [Planctomycetota bacterium]
MTRTTSHGFFDDDGFAFTITDRATPRPWSNVISNGRYGLVVSHNGGGFSWLDNSQLNVLTRWEMDLVEDRTGKHLYLHDMESGETWSAAPSPGRPAYESYACRHAPGSTRFETAYNGIETEWTLTVAPDRNVEVWAVRITNTSGRPRRIRVSSYMEWCCGVAPDSKREFHRLFIGTEYDESRSQMTVRKVMWDVPDRTEADHWNRAWPYVAAHVFVPGDDVPRFAVGDKTRFIGAGTREAPDAIREGGVQAESFGRFSDAAGALGGELTLEPGETRSVAYLTAIADDAQSLDAELEPYRSLERAFAVPAEAERAWRERLGTTAVETGLDDFDAMNNTWLRYQAISSRLWGRTGYYQQSGAFGFRDQLQDSQVWLPIDPAECRAQILRHAAQQFQDGSVYHWWHPLTNDGNHTSCSDDYLWLPFLVANYIKETDDLSILDEQTAFVDGGSASVETHCDLAIDRAFSRTSDRGLPHIGAMDWNDGLSACGLEERGESVWLGFFLSGILSDFSAVLRARGRGGRADDLLAARDRYTDAIETHAWDGAWYRRATKDDGGWLGSASNEAGRIYLNPQTWAVLNEMGSAERRETAWASVREHLLRDMGPLLLAPAYSIPDRAIGYITRYTPGSRENGGVYMHAAVWALAAACKQRDRASATRIWESISPPRRGADADAYRAEPYVTPGNVDGPDSATPGSAGWTWYTGSAAWLNRVSMEWILGIRPVFGGLLIDPCPIEGMGPVSVRRLWRGRTLRISFDPSAYNAASPAVVSLNGEALPSGMVPSDRLLAVDGEIEITVDWGPRASSLVEAAPRDVSAGATKQ